MKILLAFIFSIGIGVIWSQDIKINPEASTIKWVGKKATGEHYGTINILEGTLEIDGNNLKSGSFRIDMTTISCEDLPGRAKTKLENHLKSDDFFGVDTYPNATFIISKVKELDKGKYEIVGDMTIKNITKEIRFPAIIIKNDNKITATAELAIDRSEFNVRYGSGSFFDNLGDKLIYDDFQLYVSLSSK